jgi:DNA-binding MarR family transcriptional regulator
VKLTEKQKAILALVKEANPYGPIDFDQLIERVPYLTTKESMQFSVRALVAKDLISKGPTEIRRNRSRRLYSITPLGLHWCAMLGLKPFPQKISEEELAELDALERETIKDLF